MKPVYMINGFLESGKTEFITYTLAQPYFRIKGKTLIIACEEGEVEYDPELLKKAIPCWSGLTPRKILIQQIWWSWRKSISRKELSLNTTVCGTLKR